MLAKRSAGQGDAAERGARRCERLHVIERSLLSGYGALKLKQGGARVRVHSLSSLVEEGAALEVDCGGCEYGALLDANGLRRFGQAIVEYHRGPKPS